MLQYQIENHFFALLISVIDISRGIYAGAARETCLMLPYIYLEVCLVWNKHSHFYRLISKQLYRSFYLVLQREYNLAIRS